MCSDHGLDSEPKLRVFVEFCFFVVHTYDLDNLVDIVKVTWVREDLHCLTTLSVCLTMLPRAFTWCSTDSASRQTPQIPQKITKVLHERWHAPIRTCIFTREIVPIYLSRKM